MMSSSCYYYVNTILNLADVGTRAQSSRQPSSLDLWLKGPSFLLQEQVDARPPEHPVVVRRTLASRVDSSSGDAALDRLIEASPSLHTLNKRCAFLAAFSDFVVVVILPDPFRGMGARRNSAETQQSGHIPRSGP